MLAAGQGARSLLEIVTVLGKHPWSVQSHLDGNERIIWFSDFLLKALAYQLPSVLSLGPETDPGSGALSHLLSAGFSCWHWW